MKGRPFEDIKKLPKKVSQSRKGGSLIVTKKWKGGPSLWNGFVFSATGFECVQNQELTTHGKRAQCTENGSIALNRRSKLATVRVVPFLRKRRLKTPVWKILFKKVYGGQKEKARIFLVRLTSVLKNNP